MAVELELERQEDFLRRVGAGVTSSGALKGGPTLEKKKGNSSAAAGRSSPQKCERSALLDRLEGHLVLVKELQRSLQHLRAVDASPAAGLASNAAPSVSPDKHSNKDVPALNTKSLLSDQSSLFAAAAEATTVASAFEPQPSQDAEPSPPQRASQQSKASLPPSPSPPAASSRPPFLKARRHLVSAQAAQAAREAARRVREARLAQTLRQKARLSRSSRPSQPPAAPPLLSSPVSAQRTGGGVREATKAPKTLKENSGNRPATLSRVSLQPQKKVLSPSPPLGQSAAVGEASSLKKAPPPSTGNGLLPAKPLPLSAEAKLDADQRQQSAAGASAGQVPPAECTDSPSPPAADGKKLKEKGRVSSRSESRRQCRCREAASERGPLRAVGKEGGCGSQSRKVPPSRLPEERSASGSRREDARRLVRSSEATPKKAKESFSASQRRLCPHAVLPGVCASCVVSASASEFQTKNFAASKESPLWAGGECSLPRERKVVFLRARRVPFCGGQDGTRPLHFSPSAVAACQQKSEAVAAEAFCKTFLQRDFERRNLAGREGPAPCRCCGRMGEGSEVKTSQPREALWNRGEHLASFSARSHPCREEESAMRCATCLRRGGFNESAGFRLQQPRDRDAFCQASAANALPQEGEAFCFSKFISSLTEAKLGCRHRPRGAERRSEVRVEDARGLACAALEEGVTTQQGQPRERAAFLLRRSVEEEASVLGDQRQVLGFLQAAMRSSCLLRRHASLAVRSEETQGGGASSSSVVCCLGEQPRTHEMLSQRVVGQL